MNKTRVLIFPAGAENALEIFDALNGHMDIDVFGASGKPDHAEFLYPPDRFTIGQFYITDPNFIDNFNLLLARWEIDIVIPTHDEIALFFAMYRDKIHAKILLSPLDTALICREKTRMYQMFSDCAFVPKMWQNAEEIQIEEYPVFVKPNMAAGGQGAEIIHTPKQLKDTLEQARGAKMVICEYLPGEECTIDCYSNKDGELLFAGARMRDRVQNGIAVRSTTFKMPLEIREICNIVNTRMRFFGAWYLQLKRDCCDRWRLLEISCRQAGGMTLYRHKGINFPMLGVYELNGVPVSTMELPGKWVFDRRLQARFQLPYYYETVYVDLDDTLIVKGNVNTMLLAFLYQCINQAKKLVLLTRHMGSPADTLRCYRITPELFDEMICITFEDRKSAYIVDQNAILIDNSFAERKDVFEAKGIPVFDVDAVDCLLECIL